jgi:DNA-binding transcriptional ArsR family regulator
MPNTLNFDEEDIKRASNSLKAIAHPIRLKILCSLGNDELSVLEIVDMVGTSQSNISQHIDILREKKIILSRRKGNRVFCKIKDADLLVLIDKMKEIFCPILADLS